MPIRSGLGGQVGLAPEVTYGTYVAPTKFIEVSKATLKNDPQFVLNGGIAAGRLQKLGSRRVQTLTRAGGGLELEFFNKGGISLLLQALMGTSITPVLQNTSTGYLQTHTLADPFGKSLSIQVGVPDVATGTVQPHNYLGCKVMSGEFSCGKGDTLQAKFDITAREFSAAQAIVAPTFPAVTPMHFVQSVIKVGTNVAGAASVDGVTSATVKVDRASRDDRHYHGNAGKMSEPIINDFQMVTGSLDVDYLDKTVFEDRFHNGTGFALVWEFTGAALGGAPAINEIVRFTLPQCFLNGDTASLDGVDVVSGSFPYEATFDGTNPVKIELITTDVTI